MSLQRNGSPSFCVARRRLSMSSVGKGSLRRRIKGNIAGSFLESMSSRWSLSSKDGLADFILNDNGIRIDPLVRRRKDLNDIVDSGLDKVAPRSRSFSESLPRRRGSGFLNETQLQLPQLGWSRSNSPARWSQANGVRSLSPWRRSPGTGRQRRPSGGRFYHRHHRHSDGDVLKGEKPFGNVGRKHRHSEGDVLSKYVVDLENQNVVHKRFRKRCISEGSIDVRGPLNLEESPKSAHRTESKSSILADEENEYVETIISSLRRNSITERYRKDILIRNGFYAGNRGGFVTDHRNGNGRASEHKYRNSYCGSFGSLDSIDSWSSCDTIEDIAESGEEKVNKSNDSALSATRDSKELTPETEYALTTKTPNQTPDIIASPKFDRDNDNESNDTKFETASWMDCSYWNWGMFRTEMRPRRSLSIRNSRRQRLKEIRRRSYGGYDKKFENDLYNAYVTAEGHMNQMDDGVSLADLSEEKSTDPLNSCGTCQKGSKKCILEYLDTETENDQNTTEREGNDAEFVCLLKDQVTFCSGKHGNSENGQDDVELVFDAINKEAKKPENSEKDLMVVFFVGKDWVLMFHCFYLACDVQGELL